MFEIASYNTILNITFWGGSNTSTRCDGFGLDIGLRGCEELLLSQHTCILPTCSIIRFCRRSVAMPTPPVRGGSGDGGGDDARAIAFVVTTSFALLDSRAVPLARNIYAGLSTTFVVEERAGGMIMTARGPRIPPSHPWPSCSSRSTSYGSLLSCDELKTSNLLIARGCKSAHHDDVGIACKVERGLLFALHHQATAEWIVLCDDDVWWMMQPLQRALGALDSTLPSALGFYGCGAGAGMPQCVKQQALLPRQDAPQCLPVFATMSRPAVLAIADALESEYLQSTSSWLNHRERVECTSKCQYYMHDTALGFAIWAAGVRTRTDLYDWSAPLAKCLNMSSRTTAVVMRRPCLAMHAHSRELSHLGLSYEAALERAVDSQSMIDGAIRAAMASRPAGDTMLAAKSCSGSATAFDRLRTAASVRQSADGNGLAALRFLRDCLNLSLHRPAWAQRPLHRARLLSEAPLAWRAPRRRLWEAPTPQPDCVRSPVHQTSLPLPLAYLLVGDSHERSQVEAFCGREGYEVRTLCECAQCRLCYSPRSNVLLLSLFLFGVLTPRHIHVACTAASPQPSNHRQGRAREVGCGLLCVCAIHRSSHLRRAHAHLLPLLPCTTHGRACSPDHVYRGSNESMSTRARTLTLLPTLLAQLGISSLRAIQVNVALWDAFAQVHGYPRSWLALTCTRLCSLDGTMAVTHPWVPARLSSHAGFAQDDHRATVGPLEQLSSGLWLSRTMKLLVSLQALAREHGTPLIVWRNAPPQLQRDHARVHSDLMAISALGVAAACAVGGGSARAMGQPPCARGGGLPIIDWRSYTCRALLAAGERPPSGRRPCGGLAWCSVFKGDMLHLLPEHYVKLTQALIDFDGAPPDSGDVGGGNCSSAASGQPSMVLSSCDTLALRQRLHYGECMTPTPPAPPYAPPGVQRSPPPPWPLPPEPSPPPPGGSRRRNKGDGKTT